MDDEGLDLGDIKDPQQRFFAKFLLETRGEFRKSVQPLYKIYNDQITNFDRAHDEALKLVATISFGVAGAWLPLLQIGQSQFAVSSTDIWGISILCAAGFCSVGWVLLKSTLFVADGFSKNYEVKQIEKEALDIPEMKKPPTNEKELDKCGKAFLPYEKKLREITNRTSNKWMPHFYYSLAGLSLVLMVIGIMTLAIGFLQKSQDGDASRCLIYRNNHGHHSFFTLKTNVQ